MDHSFPHLTSYVSRSIGKGSTLLSFGCFLRVGCVDEGQKKRMMENSIEEALLGFWKGSVAPDPTVAAVNFVLHFGAENVLGVFADGAPEAKGGYELKLENNPPMLCLIVPVSMAPLMMVSIVEIDGDLLRIRIVDDPEENEFLQQVQSTPEQLMLTRVGSAPAPSQAPALQEPCSSMAADERKIGVVQEYLKISM